MRFALIALLFVGVAQGQNEGVGKEPALDFNFGFEIHVLCRVLNPAWLSEADAEQLEKGVKDMAICRGFMLGVLRTLEGLEELGLLPPGLFFCPSSALSPADVYVAFRIWSKKERILGAQANPATGVILSLKEAFPCPE